MGRSGDPRRQGRRPQGQDEVLDDPEFQAWVKDVKAHLIPKLHDSLMTISLVPESAEGVDLKYAVELGLSIMMDKPLILGVRPGTPVPEHLARAADEIVEIDFENDPDGTRIRMGLAIDRLKTRLDGA